MPHDLPGLRFYSDRLKWQCNWSYSIPVQWCYYKWFDRNLPSRFFKCRQLRFQNQRVVSRRPAWLLSRRFHLWLHHHAHWSMSIRFSHCFAIHDTASDYLRYSNNTCTDDMDFPRYSSQLNWVIHRLPRHYHYCWRFSDRIAYRPKCLHLRSCYIGIWNLYHGSKQAWRLPNQATCEVRWSPVYKCRWNGLHSGSGWPLLISDFSTWLITSITDWDHWIQLRFIYCFLRYEPLCLGSSSMSCHIYLHCQFWTSDWLMQYTIHLWNNCLWRWGRRLFTFHRWLRQHPTRYLQHIDYRNNRNQQWCAVVYNFRPQPDQSVSPRVCCIWYYYSHDSRHWVHNWWLADWSNFWRIYAWHRNEWMSLHLELFSRLIRLKSPLNIVYYIWRQHTNIHCQCRFRKCPISWSPTRWLTLRRKLLWI